MTTKAKTPGRLSDVELNQLLALIRKVDSVELKLTVPDSNRRSAAAALDVDPSTPRFARSSSSTRLT